MSSTKMRTFVLSTKICVPLFCPDVFEPFSDAFQLQQLTPPWLKFRVLTPGPIEMRQGQLIDYQIGLHGMPIRWRTEITEWEPPFRFTDSQIKGPYRRWVHTYTFEEIDGGTLMRDRIEYSVLGGSLVNRLFVQGDLKQIFNYRHDQLPGMLGVRAEDCDRGDIVFSTEAQETPVVA